MGFGDTESTKCYARFSAKIIEEESRMLLHNATASTEIETIDLFPRSMTMVGWGWCCSGAQGREQTLTLGCDLHLLSYPSRLHPTPAFEFTKIFLTLIFSNQPRHRHGNHGEAQPLLRARRSSPGYS